MKASEFTKLMSAISLLNHHQRTELIAAFEHSSDEIKTNELIESAFDTRKACPHCACTKLYRHGVVNGLQRYRCQACKKTFNALTKTPLTRLRHKSKWLAYLNDVIDSLTVRKAACHLGVHRNTTFRWRHRFLTWIKEERPPVLYGITEVDETYLPESFKGSRHLSRPPRKRGNSVKKRGLSKEQVCIVVARDRSKQTLDFVTGKGSVTKAALHSCLDSVLDNDALLVSDGNPSYGAFCKEAHITHEVVNLSQGQRVIDGAIHIQNVNAYHSRFKSWVKNRFHGVATKYLLNYLGWQRVMDEYKDLNSTMMLNSAIGNFQHLTVT